jgi:hypothetical protein
MSDCVAIPRSAWPSREAVVPAPVSLMLAQREVENEISTNHVQRMESD